MGAVDDTAREGLAALEDRVATIERYIIGRDDWCCLCEEEFDQQSPVLEVAALGRQRRVHNECWDQTQASGVDTLELLRMIREQEKAKGIHRA